MSVNPIPDIIINFIDTMCKLAGDRKDRQMT